MHSFLILNAQCHFHRAPSNNWTCSAPITKTFFLPGSSTAGHPVGWKLGSTSGWVKKETLEEKSPHWRPFVIPTVNWGTKLLLARIFIPGSLCFRLSSFIIYLNSTICAEGEVSALPDGVLPVPPADAQGYTGVPHSWKLGLLCIYNNCAVHHHCNQQRIKNTSKFVCTQSKNKCEVSKSPELNAL